MVNSINEASQAARKAIESQYSGICDIVEYRDVKDARTKITHKEEVTIIENRPCRLLFKRLNTIVTTETAASVSQVTKLFISPEIEINSGSKIIVTQDNVTTAYSASGEPAVYSTHQEIMLELFKGWA